MTLRRKIILSNLFMIVIPVILLFVLWGSWLTLNGGAGLRPISRASKDGDSLGAAQNILYLYEAELSDMDWTVVALPGENGADIVLSPEKERIEELNSLGYHLQVDSEEALLFSNLDDHDRTALDAAETGAKGAMLWSGDSIIIRDSFLLGEETCVLTAVYQADRSDHGVAGSMVPMYMVSTNVLWTFLIIAAVSIALTCFLLSRWLRRSILEPLETLKQGADRIAENDLDHAVVYDKADEFGDVVSQFERMRLQLRQTGQERETYERDRRELLGGVSHDLRSPLTSIKGYALGLRDGIADTEEKRQRYYQAILTRTEDLERLTGSLSVLVNLENGSSVLRMEKVELNQFLTRFLQEKLPYLEENKVKLDVQSSACRVPVQLDPTEMKRVLTNLLENTVRHRGSQPSNVRLRLSVKDTSAVIDYLDDGPGVPAEHLDHLFESFYRVDSARTKPEQGSGLGLAIVKRIVEGHGGTTEAYLDGGLGIRITLPLEEGSEEQ